jgi:hypothetical protein
LAFQAEMMTKTALALLLLFSVSWAAQSQGAPTVCVATTPASPPTTAGAPDLLCRSGNLSFRFDSRPQTVWPHEKCQKVEGLDSVAAHRVTVLCDGKPQQSFRFRFSDYKSPQLCLFINDLYQTAQLWEASRSPWCRCQ